MAQLKINSLKKATPMYVTIKVSRQLKARILIAKCLFLLAGKVLGCGSKVKIKEA